MKQGELLSKVARISVKFGKRPGAPILISCLSSLDMFYEALASQRNGRFQGNDLLCCQIIC